MYVVTQKGIDDTLRANGTAVKDVESGVRAVGKPIKGYEDKVPDTWLKHGWVEWRETE